MKKEIIKNDNELSCKVTDGNNTARMAVTKNGIRCSKELIKMKNKQNILDDNYSKIIIETEDTKEILAVIKNDEIKTANNIQVRLTPTYN